MLAVLVLKSNYSKISELYEKVTKAYDMIAKFDHSGIYI